MSGVVTDDRTYIPTSLPVLRWFFVAFSDGISCRFGGSSIIYALASTFSPKRRGGDFSFFYCVGGAGRGCSLILLVGIANSRLSSMIIRRISSVPISFLFYALFRMCQILPCVDHSCLIRCFLLCFIS